MVKLVELWLQKISNSSEIKDALEVYEGQDESVEPFRIAWTLLSLLEFLLHLSALEVSEQKSLEVTDEKLILFLRDEDSSGASEL